MKTVQSIISLTALISTCITSSAAVYTMGSPVANPANGHLYQLLSPAPWTDSEAFAQSLGGHLATINDAAENQWVYNTFPTLTGISQPVLWIGFNDATVEGNWVWASGEAATYTFWYFGEPNNTPNADATGEDYAAIRPPGYTPAGSWNDLPTNGGGVNGTVYGVVELVPEPQSLALLAMGLGAFFGIRCRRK